MANIYKNVNQMVTTPDGRNVTLAEIYKQQTLQGFTLPGSPLMKHDLASLSNQMQVYFAEGGLFADPCLDRAIINATLLPMHSVANSIPVRPSNFELTRWGYLTNNGLDTLIGDRPVNPCDPSPTYDDDTACYMECRKGRTSTQTKTGELDALIRLACRGVQDDLFFLGDTRGVSAIAGLSSLQNADYVRMGALRRAMQKAGQALQFDILRQTWTGDPANNTAGGGFREFRGLLSMIADDYDTPANHPGLTGDNCEKLNSCVMDFGGECIGGGQAIYPWMQALEADLFARAQMMGFSSVDWRWVMHRRHWEELVKVLPCEHLSDSCVAPTVNQPQGANLAPIHINVASDGQVAIRQDMQRNMTIMVNGRIYPVLLDDSLPLISDGGTPPQFTGSIFLIPWSVNGTQVLYWEHADYSAFSDLFGPIPGSIMDLLGYHDSGRYHSTVRFNGRCLEIDTKAELCLIFKTPQLSGRIDEIRVCSLKPNPAFPDAEMFQPVVP